MTEKPDIFEQAGLTDADFEDDVEIGAASEDGGGAPADASVEPPVDTPAADPAAPAAPDGPARGPDGRFTAREPEDAQDPTQQPAPAPAAAAPEAPSDLNLTAAERAAWATTPPEVRAAVERRIGELQNGYRATVAPLRPFLDHYGSAEQMAQYLGGVAQFEGMLRQNPAQGFANICQALNVDVRAVAAQIVGQPAPERDQVIDGLRGELAALKQQFGGVAQTVEQQRQSAVTQSVHAFAASHPRFDELSGEIATMLKTGYAASLEDAYAKAERLNPAPAAPALQQAPAPAAAAPEAPRARTPAANLSVSGTPANGSNPNPRTPPSDRRASIDWALTQAGL